jgi:hypothetical protein
MTEESVLKKQRIPSEFWRDFSIFGISFLLQKNIRSVMMILQKKEGDKS